MLDFKTLSSLQIPEGVITKISVNGANLWPISINETWDLEWIYSSGLPSTSDWEYPLLGIDGYEIPGEGLYMRGIENAKYAGIQAVNHDELLGQKANYEIVFTYDWVDYNGVRFVLGEGTDGVASGRGLQCTIRIGDDGRQQLHILEGSDPIRTNKNNAYVDPNAVHTLRLELDTINNNNRIYFDGVLMAVQTNDQLSTVNANHVWTIGQIAAFTVKEIRYKKFA